MCTKKLLSRSVLLLSLLGIAGYVSGCAKDVGVIDRTYPNRVKKSIFMNDDQWYFMQTIVQTDFQGSLGLFEGLQGGVKRIRWVVTEDTLFAYDVLAPAIGAGHKLTDVETRRLGVVAAFPIRGHFDIQRGYNTSTGQLTNVISENSSDRPWQEREYMRVDWSNNRVAGGLSSELGQLASLTRTVPDDGPETDFNRTRITDNTIDVVNEYYFEPDIFACFGMFGIDSLSQCSAGPAAVRSFFMKVGDRAKRYEPLLYPDVDYLKDDNGDKIYMAGGTVCNSQTIPTMQNAGDCTAASFDVFKRFGYFRTERTIYTERRGAHLDSHRRYYANRWHIWQNDYEEGCDRSDSACKPLPLKDRKPKQVVYYLSPGFPEDKSVLKGVEQLQEQWNQVLSKTVYLTHREEIDGQNTDVDGKAQAVRDMIAKYNDGDDHMYRIKFNSCSPTGLMVWKKTHGANLNQKATELLESVDKESLLKMKHKPLLEFCAKLEFLTQEEADPKNRFDWQRPGDLRYSFVAWDYNNAPWLGYGPVGTDPMTGEILSGTANFAGNLSQSYAAMAADTILFEAGRYSEFEVANGTYFNDQQDKNAVEEIEEEERKLLASSPEKMKEVLTPYRTDYASDLAYLREKSRQEAASLTLTPEEKKNSLLLLRNPDKLNKDVALHMEQLKTNRGLLEGKLTNLLAQPEFLQGLLSDKSFAVYYNSIAEKFKEKDGTLTEEGKKKTLDQLFNQTNVLDRRDKLNRFAAKNNIISREMLDDAMFNVTQSYRAAVPFFKNMSRKEIEKAFVSRVFYSTQLHEIGHTMGLRHNFSGSADAINYHPGFWDQFIKVKKGGKTEADLDFDVTLPQWAQENLGPNAFVKDNWAPLTDPGYFGQAEFREAAIMDYTPGLISGSAGLGRYDNAAIQFAYANQIEGFESEPDLVKSLLNRFKLNLNSFTLDGVGSLFKAGKGNNLDGIEMFAQNRKWRDVDEVKKEATDLALQGEVNRGPNVVPYRFCTDDYRGSQFFCDTFDYGASITEILSYYIDNWKNINIQSRYIQGRYFKLYQNLSRYQLLIANIVRESQHPFDFYSYARYSNTLKTYAPEFYGDLEAATLQGLNFITDIIAQPEPGNYCLNQGDFLYLQQDQNGSGCTDPIKVSMKEGAVFYPDYTEDYNITIRRVGSYFGKLTALQSLFIVSNNVAAQFFSTNIKARDRSYWNGFRQQFDAYMKSIITDDNGVSLGVVENSQYQGPKIIWKEQFADPNAPSPQVHLPRLRFTGAGNFSLQQIAIILNLLVNNTPYDNEPNAIQFMKVCASNTECFNECRATKDMSTGEWKYEPATNNVIECKVFEHPETSQVYIAPIGKNKKSIAADFIDELNSLKALRETVVQQIQVTSPSDQVTLNNLYKRRDNIDSVIELKISLLDLIRLVMKGGLY